MDANTTVHRRRNCSPYPPEELARFEAILKEQQAGLLQCCQGLSHVALRKSGDPAGDDASIKDDAAEMASDLCEQDLSLNFLSRAELELQNIAEALERIEHRSYGGCDQCDQAIPIAVLEAIPTAATCVPSKS
jgi:RNA polymerase-binding transcription factor DksA